MCEDILYDYGWKCTLGQGTGSFKRSRLKEWSLFSCCMPHHIDSIRENLRGFYAAVYVCM